jgi:hypothetical protein
MPSSSAPRRAPVRARRVCTLLAALLLAAPAAACSGGQYSTSTQRYGGSDRGETNGRMFDYVSMSADGDQWEVRIRGN